MSFGAEAETSMVVKVTGWIDAACYPSDVPFRLQVQGNGPRTCSPVERSMVVHVN